MNIEKHIEFWKEGAEDAFGTAELLIQNGRRLHGLFFCHLAIEKILKAHVTKTTGQFPPKSHHLERLATLAKLDISGETKDLLGNLMFFQIEGRYQDNYPVVPDKEETNKLLNDIKELLEWFKKKL